MRLLCWKSSSKIWSQLHERSFRRLGGVPRVIVLDNLREGVLRAEYYDPELNPLYRDMLAHYGAVALPCRVRHPDRKGKVESAIGHTQRTPLAGKRFETIEQAQHSLDDWDERWASTRIHGTTKRQVAAMFAEEKPELLPLPVEPFRYYEYGERTVHLDGCVEIQKGYYGVAPHLIGQRLPVQWDDRHVRILDPVTKTLLREYERERPGRRRVRPEDIPKKTPDTTTQLLARARHAGSNIGALCETIHAQSGQAGVRQILGVLSLVKRHGRGDADDACAIALDCETPTYRFVRRFIEHKKSRQMPLRHVDPLIRQLTEYRDLIEQRTKGDNE